MTIKIFKFKLKLILMVSWAVYLLLFSRIEEEKILNSYNTYKGIATNIVLRTSEGVNKEEIINITKKACFLYVFRN